MPAAGPGRPRPPRRSSGPGRRSPAGTPPSARGRPSCAPTRRTGPQLDQTALGERLASASTWCSAGASRTGSEVPISRWSTSPRICSSSQASSWSSSMSALPARSTRAARESTTTSRACVAEVAGVAPAVGLRLPVGSVGEPVELLGEVDLAVAVVRRGSRCQSASSARVGRRQVAEVLVDPVRPQPGRRPARATSRWPPSRAATRGWCSSRRGCRGRRRSSRSAGSRAASGSPGRSRRAGRGARTPRSP